MPAADSRVRSRNIRPPGMKISFWVGRSAPPDSTRLIIGSRFCQRDLAGPQRLLQRVRVGRAAAHRRVVGDDQALDALDHADAGDHARADRVVGAPGGERRQLEERRVRGRAAARCARGAAACRARGAGSRTSRRRRPPPCRARRPARRAAPAAPRGWPRTRRATGSIALSATACSEPQLFAMSSVRISVVPPPMPEDPHVAVLPLDLGVAHVAHPAVQLHGLVDDLLAGLDRGVLRQATSVTSRLAGSDPRRDRRACRPGHLGRAAPSRPACSGPAAG